MTSDTIAVAVSFGVLLGVFWGSLVAFAVLMVKR